MISPLLDQTYYSNNLITFEGIVSDEEDLAEDFTVEWKSTIDGTLQKVNSIPNSEGLVLGYGYLSQGEHAIELHVEDSTGKANVVSRIIQVGPPNSSPNCEITAPESSSASATGSIVDFMALVSDVDIPNNQLSVSWHSDKDGTIGESIPSSAGEVLFSYSALSVNTHTITITVTDEQGLSCTDFISYTVGTPPSITIDAPTMGEIFPVGSIISFQATIFDAQDLPEDIALNWSINGNTVTTQRATSTGTAQWLDSTLPFGSYNLVVTATDTDGLTDADQISFVVNAPPSQPNISISPSVVSTSDSFSVHIDTPSSDPEGSTITYSYAWYKNNIQQVLLSTPSISASDTQKGEIWMVYVTPNDGLSNGSYGQAQITISNTPPTISTVSITPSTSINNQSILSCSATATDPDESPLITYEWSTNNSTLQTGGTLELGAYSLSPETIIVCTATATDSDSASATSSTSISIENRLPLVDSISLSPLSAFTNDTLITSAIFSDPDGQSSLSGSYEWHVINNSTGTDNIVQTGSDNTLSGMGNFQKNDEVYVMVTANDGIADGIPISSSSITILNSPPSSASLLLSPIPAYAEEDDLFCTIDLEAVDDDGDTILYTYLWTDPNGVNVQTTTHSTQTQDVLSGTNTIEGTYICSVIPFDGTVDGPSAQSSLIIENGCPQKGDGSQESCPSTDCAKIHADGHSVGDGIYWIDPQQTGSAYEVFCLMDSQYDGGGWTQILTSSDDGQDTWTWNNKAYWTTDTTIIGSLTTRNEDFKSMALHDVGMQDILFIHAPSEIWAGYNQIDSGAQTFAAFLQYANGPICYEDTDGFTLSSGTLFVSGNLCTTNLFFNPQDRDGGSCPGNGDSAWGPAWSADKGAGCSFDDPGISGGLGPNGSSNHPANEYVNNGSLTGVGFGMALGMNTGTSGSGENYMQIFVRRNYNDQDGDGYVGWQDCDDSDNSIFDSEEGISENCAAQSCKSILDKGYSTGNGFYWIRPYGNNSFEVYCDMTTDGGGWTRVVNIQNNSKAHAGTGAAVGDISDLSAVAKLSDVHISKLNTIGHWWFQCGSSKDVYVQTASRNFDSHYVNAEDWSIDNNKDGIFECGANRAQYVFSDHPLCSSGHTDYASHSDGNGCYTTSQGWNLSGALWAR